MGVRTGGEALKEIIEVLEQLDEKDRNRVLSSASAYFNGPPIQPRPNPAPSRGSGRG